jgi:hypothetical protein
LRPGTYVFDGTVTDTKGQPVILTGEYDVLVKGSGALQTGLLSRRVRAEIELQGLARTGHSTIRPLGGIDPFRPDHEVNTAELMTSGLAAGYDTWAGPTPNAEPAYLRFSVNFWHEVFGDHLIEVRLMGDRASTTEIGRLQPGVSTRAYSILVVVADVAGDVGTNSDFWREQIATTSPFNTERLRCGLQRIFDLAIKKVSDLGAAERTSTSFQATIDAALLLCRRKVAS